MKPHQVAVDFASRVSSSDEFEKISYPSDSSDWNPPPIVSSYNTPEELPLHYMSEDKARRRVIGRGGGDEYGGADPIDHGGNYYDDEGKDVYSKTRPNRGRIGSGRLRRAPPPPPTSIVRVSHLLLPHNPTHNPLQREFLLQNLEHLPPAIYTLLSCWTHFHKIGHAGLVVWDEAHFGKFGSHYLKREFYFDVHPPLGKMLVGLAGLLSGYDGSFEFKSGAEYGDAVPYVAMRVMMATFGVAMVPLGWYTAQELGMSVWATHLVAIMVLCGKFTHSIPFDWLTPFCRCGLALYLPIHSTRLYVTILHIHYCLLPH